MPYSDPAKERARNHRRMRARNHRWRATGVCLSCGKPRDCGLTRCAHCTARELAAKKRRRERRRQAGVCANCGKPKPKTLLTCAHCRAVIMKNGRLLRARLRAAVFRHYGDRCQRCGTTQHLGVHHINNDGRQLREAAKKRGTDFYIEIVGTWPTDIEILCNVCHGKHHSHGAQWITHNGETLSRGAWAHRLGISRQSLAARLKNGWTIADAVMMPKLPRGTDYPNRQQTA